MGAGDSGKGLYDHLYRRFFENRKRQQGYDFQHAPGGSAPTPGVAFRDRLRWWSWGRWQRRKTIMAARDRFQQDILDIKTRPPGRVPIQGETGGKSNGRVKATEGLRHSWSLSGGALLVGAGLMVGAITVVFGGEHALSRTEFCVSCHSQTYPYEELKKSSHYGALGADPGCKDCHVPQGLGNFHLALWTHMYDGARAVLAEMKYDYSTVEKFNERRQIMAHYARMSLKNWDSVTCRDCHKNTKPPGASAKAAHKKMETEGATCIDCHQNLVHKKVPEMDLNASKAQGTMVLKEEKKEKGED